MVEDQEVGLSKILSKYISVWLWSIIFGSLAGITFSYFSSSRFDGWGQLSVVFAILLYFGGLSVAFGWISLYRYLSQYLIPLFVLNQAPDDSKHLEVDHVRAARNLRTAFRMMVLAVIARILMEVVLYALTFLGSGIGTGARNF